MTFKLEIDKLVYKDLDYAIDYHSEAKAKTILSAFLNYYTFFVESP